MEVLGLRRRRRRLQFRHEARRGRFPRSAADAGRSGRHRPGASRPEACRAGQPRRQADALPGHGLGGRAVSSLSARCTARPNRRAQYLAERGISDESIRAISPGLLARQLAVADGSCPDHAASRPPCWKRPGWSARSQDGRRVYDRFRGRLIFSIRDTEHRPIAFGARILPGSRQRRQRRPEVRQFARNAAVLQEQSICTRSTSCATSLPRDPQIVVVEGYTDVIMAHQHGVQQRRGRAGNGVGRTARPPAAAICRTDHAGARWRRGRPAADQRNSGAVRRGPGRSADPDAARRARSLRFHSPARGRTPSASCSTRRSTPWSTSSRTVTDGLDVVQDPDRAHRALEEILSTLANAPRLSGVTSAVAAAARTADAGAAGPPVPRGRDRRCAHGWTNCASSVRQTGRTPRRRRTTASPLIARWNWSCFEILLAHPGTGGTRRWMQIRSEQLSSSTGDGSCGSSTSRLSDGADWLRFRARS